MKKLMFCYYKYILSKYFCLLKNSKQIKIEFTRKNRQRKETLCILQTKIQMETLKRCFNVLEKWKNNKKYEKLMFSKIWNRACFGNLQKAWSLWRKAFADFQTKRKSIVELNECLQRKTAQIKSLNFREMRDYVFGANDKRNNNNEEMSKEEMEIRLEIKYQNLEKLIQKFENFKAVLNENLPRDGEKDLPKENEILLLKTLIKTQMREIEQLKSLLLS